MSQTNYTLNNSDKAAWDWYKAARTPGGATSDGMSQAYRSNMPNNSFGVKLGDSPATGSQLGNVDLGGAKGLAADSVNLNNDSTFLGMDNNQWKGAGTLANIGMGAKQTWTAMEQLGLAKDAFKFNKDMKQKEYGMARDAYDKNVARRESVSDQMRALQPESKRNNVG